MKIEAFVGRLQQCEGGIIVCTVFFSTRMGGSETNLYPLLERAQGHAVAVYQRI